MAEETYDAEQLVEAIRSVSDGFDRLLNAGLTRRALVVLIQNAAPGKMSRRDIETVLDALPQLGNIYLEGHARLRPLGGRDLTEALSETLEEGTEYRLVELLQLLGEAGVRPSGKRPDNTLLSAIQRSPDFSIVASGRYRYDGQVDG